MSVRAIEAIVENGQVRLPANIRLPEQTKVYVVIPDGVSTVQTVRILSPRLVRREQAKEFEMEVVVEGE